MGLISRVSSRTYRKSSKKTKKMVLSITNKLQKRAGARASDIENTVASAILDIQNNADPATKEQLMQLHVIAVKEMDVGGRNAIAIMVPPPQVPGWQKIQVKIVRELEKKFSGKHVMVICQRKVMAKEARKAGAKCYKQKRPISQVSKMSTKTSLRTSSTQLSSSARGSDTNLTTARSSKLTWTEAARPPSSTKPPLSVPFTSD